MGPQYADLSGRVLQILALTLWPIAGYQVAAAAILGVAKQRRMIPIFFGEAAVNVVLSIILVRTYGVVGTAIGTLIPRLVMSMIVGPWFVRREIGLPLRTFWFGALIQPTVAMVPFAMASYAVERFWPATHLAVYFAQVGLVLPIAALGVWIVCLSPVEREDLAGRVLAFSRRRLVRPR
jgi:Na+-driven multidrug efflux pump